MLHGDLLAERARLTPEATGLVEVATGRRLTYGELEQRACRCARMLRGDLGLGKGDRLGLLCGNRAEFLDVFFAAAKTGVILVPLNTHLAARELELIVRDSGMHALIHDAEHGATARELRERVKVERSVIIGGGNDAGGLTYESLVQKSGEASFRRTPCAPEDPFCLLYTSGTTGKPKGVVIPHRMVSWNGYNTVACWQLRSDDVSPIFTPLYHAGGLGAFLLPIFTVGGTIVLHAGFDPDEVWHVIEQERCTVVLGVPAIWKLLADASAFGTTDLSHVRWFISGGAPLPPSLVELYRDRGIILRQGYGLTEVGVNCFSMTDTDAWEHLGSVGKPLMFTEAKVVGDDGAEVPEGEVGELCFRGPHVSAGYWNNPEATAEGYDDDGWFHTGDLARCDAEGFFFIVGR
ncbi:MAG: AMP-binding protein, partial [Acidobacteria bacterium]|nr:AMP-binding protein [Acidobacteriota bacterium]